MRKIFISILLASAAASPALAQDQDGHGRWHREQSQSDHQQAKEERQQAREQAHQERFNGNAERVQDQRAAPQFVAPQQVQREQRGGWDRSRFERTAPQQVVEQQGDAPRQSFDRSGGNWRDRSDRSVAPSGWTRSQNGWTRTDGDFRQSDRAVPNVMRNPNPTYVERADRDRVQTQYRDRSRWASGGWNRDWRNDHRYDWRSYRDRHRSIFHIGIYYDPFGWGYRPYNIGYRLVPAYYGQEYWIDPAMYSLPFPPPGTEWVRYWNDALLVDIYSGEVVDVIHNFFW